MPVAADDEQFGVFCLVGERDRGTVLDGRRDDRGTGVVRRLVALEGEGRLGSEQVRLAAGALKVSERSVWRWVRQCPVTGDLPRRQRLTSGEEF